MRLPSSEYTPGQHLKRVWTPIRFYKYCVLLKWFVTFIQFSWTRQQFSYPIACSLCNRIRNVSILLDALPYCTSALHSPRDKPVLPWCSYDNHLLKTWPPTIRTHHVRQHNHEHFYVIPNWLFCGNFGVWYLKCQEQPSEL